MGCGVGGVGVILECVLGVVSWLCVVWVRWVVGGGLCGFFVGVWGGVVGWVGGGRVGWSLDKGFVEVGCGGVRLRGWCRVGVGWDVWVGCLGWVGVWVGCYV